jgi:hypothetical protein
MTNTQEPWAKPKEAMSPWLRSSGSLGLRSMTDIISLILTEGNRETRFPVRLSGDRRFPRWLGEPISPTKPGSKTLKVGAAKDLEL